jgi:crotonobetainyl-CoA:carnitine CoA-transferase CaiB-like acyl-CoA transferase
VRLILDGVLADLGLDDPGEVEVIGDPRPAALSSRLAVADCAVAAVAACLVAAADLAMARTGRRPDVGVDVDHAAAVMRSEALLRDPDGQAGVGFAPLSRLWQAADGWVRTHANYPWHRAALLASFGLTDEPDAAVTPRLAALIAGLRAPEVEQLLYESNGLAVAARTDDQWRSSDVGKAVAAFPLVAREPLDNHAHELPAAQPGSLPAAGLRILDLTRVIAGPAATRMLGALGAEVLRVDPPQLPEHQLSTIDGVIGKVSTALDATTELGRERLHALLDDADVLVTGYRPDALRKFGLSPDQVADQHPGTIVVSLSAWGATGPWGTRRGFDSLVQIASGSAGRRARTTPDREHCPANCSTTPRDTSPRRAP